MKLSTNVLSNTTLQRNPSCRLCVLHETAQFICLLGAGKQPSDVMIIGEAPGHREDDSGKPLIGRAGQVLEKMLQEICRWERSDVFITNAVSCRPPDNRTPTKREIKACGTWLDHQFAVVHPKYVLLLGNVPLEAALGVKGIKKYRGKPITREGIIYLPTYHPSSTFYDPSTEEFIRSDLRSFRDIVAAGKIPEAEGLSYHIVNDETTIRQMLEDLKGDVSFDVETTGLYPWDKGARVVSLGLGTEKHQWCIPISHPESKWDGEEIEYLLRSIDVRLKHCYIIAHNGKFDTEWIYLHYGYKWLADFDTMLADYMIDENRKHGLKFLAQLYFGAPDWEIDKSEKMGINVPLDRHCKYLAHDVFYTRKLWQAQRKRLAADDGVRRVFEKILMPCARLFVDIEVRGFYVDTNKMDKVETRLKQDIQAASEELKKYGEINWGSPKQVGELFFKKLQIPVIEKTKKGAASTSESVLKRIDHPATAALLKFRGAKQQLSFFIDGWKPFLVNKRIHPSFKLHGTTTGRLSCEHPNIQQVPRDPLIRSLITAPLGYTLIDADLSQIELRIAAEIAGEKTMLKAFRDGIDVHWLTMVREFRRSGAHPELVKSTTKIENYSKALDKLLEMGPDSAIKIDSRWKELRKKAKAIGFGFLYGMWWKKFRMYARDNYDVIVSDSEAQEARVAFFDLYGGFEDWHKRQRQFARRNGYVRSLSGRKRRLPDAMSSEDTPQRGEAERQAINCVTTDTEILTPHGWKTVDDLGVGDPVFSVNPLTKNLEIHPLVAINRGMYSGVMWQIDHNSISALVTPDHRWLVSSSDYTKTLIKKTSNLTMNGHDKIWITSGGFENNNTLWTNDEVELAGWVLSDGYYRKHKKWNPRSVGVTQSKPKYLKEIDDLFNRLGKHSHRYRDKPTSEHFWDISCEAGVRLREMMPKKILTIEFLLSMSSHQRKLLLTTMCKGDGSWSNRQNRFRRMHLENEEEANAFLILCALTGQAARSNSRDQRHRQFKKYDSMPNIAIPTKPSWYVEMVKNVYAQPQYRSKWVEQKEVEVWCPSVKNEAWVAKRKGKVFITGNSPVQSFANEINLMILLQIAEEYPPPLMYPVGTVHDSVLAEVRNDKLEEIHDRILEIARRPKLFDDFQIKLSVPIEAEAKVGPWGLGKELR